MDLEVYNLKNTFSDGESLSKSKLVGWRSVIRVLLLNVEKKSANIYTRLECLKKSV